MPQKSNTALTHRKTCRLLYATCSFLSRNFIYLTTISSIGTGSQRKFACEFGGIEINLRRSPCNSLIRLLFALKHARLLELWI